MLKLLKRFSFNRIMRRSITPIHLAILSLVVSIISSGFAVYQWWNSDRHTRIQAAIELSKAHIENAVDPEEITMRVSIGTALYKDLIVARHYYARVEYAAYLANQKLADERYFSKLLACAIVKLARAKNESPLNVSTVEARKFEERSTLDCSADGAPEEEDDASPDDKNKSDTPPTNEKK